METGTHAQQHLPKAQNTWGLINSDNISLTSLRGLITYGCISIIRIISFSREFDLCGGHSAQIPCNLGWGPGEIKQWSDVVGSEIPSLTAKRDIDIPEYADMQILPAFGEEAQARGTMKTFYSRKRTCTALPNGFLTLMTTMLLKWPNRALRQLFDKLEPVQKKRCSKV